MPGKTRIWLSVALTLSLVGCIMFAGVMTALKWDFAKLSTAKYETNTYPLTESFSGILINADTADIVLTASDDGICSVVCYEAQYAKHSVSVKEDTLVIDVIDTRKWYEYIGINFDTPKITVFVPQGNYGALSINGSTGDMQIPKDFAFESIDILTSTGDITNNASASGHVQLNASTGSIYVQDISAAALDLSVSTGKVDVTGVTCEGNVKLQASTGKANLTDIRCKNLISDADTGDISLKNVIANEAFSIETDTGDVKLDGCDAAKISIETDTGDVRGNLLSDKIFITETDTGRVDVPKTVTGGKCEISTDTGDIKITVN